MLRKQLSACRSPG